MTSTDSEFIRHVPCKKCNSSDANAEYSDGHTFCFSCGARTEADGTAPVTQAPRARGTVPLIRDIEVRGIRARKITDETCAHFRYGFGDFKGKKVHVAPYFDASGNLVAQKVRFKDKKFLVTGSLEDALPFGAQAFPKSGRMIVVTEGEVDALSMSQVQGNKWPVVSIGCGAGPQVKKYIAKHRDYFLGFEKVVLMFDNDEPGRRAALDAAAVIGTGRAHIAELPLKDANAMLMEGKVEELINAMWKAAPYRPEGLLDLADLKESVLREPEYGLSWPFERLTKLTYGIRSGELYAFGAGTGIGKTDLFTQTMKHLVVEHGAKVGIFALEQEPRETATRLLGKFAGIPFHIPDAGWTAADMEDAWDSMVTSRQVFFYDHFGNASWDLIREKIEYLYHSEGVRYFFLDHLTALATWQDDERVALDQIMSDMGGLVKKLGITLFFVSHLATPDGKPHEEGGRVMIRHFRGSRSIGYWSHFMFGMERNQQADDPEERSTTTFRVLKDRFTGRATGEVMFLKYDHATGLLTETQPKETEDYGFTNQSENKTDF